MSRVPPHDLEAERSVLGAILIDSQCMDRVSEELQPEDFYVERHRKIYAQALTLTAANEPVDLLTMCAALTAMGKLTECGGAAYISELSDGGFSAANVAYYAKIIHNQALLRRVIAAASSIMDRAFSGVPDVPEFLDEIEQQIFSIAQETKRRRSLRRIGETTIAWLQRVEDRYKNKGSVTGLATGFTDLDRMLTGLRPGEVIVVAGRPGMGKTSLGLNVAEYVALEVKKGVAIFSLEMGYEELEDKLHASRSRVPLTRIRSGYLSEADFPRLAESAGDFSDAQVWVDDSAASTVLEIRAVARRLMAEKSVNLGLIIVDYLQLMTPATKVAGQSREQDVSEISRSLKKLAKELGVPVMVLSQLNREVERRNPPTPRLSDLRESGSIEQDADVCAFLYREDYYLTDSPRKNETDIMVAKQRNGPTGVVVLAWQPEFTRFENLERSDWTPST